MTRRVSVRSAPALVDVPAGDVPSPSTPVRPVARPTTRQTSLLMSGAGILAAAVFWLVRGALIDDAYITLSYARNVATDLHWGLIPTERANSATSPLNVMLLAAATAVLRPFVGVEPVWGLGILVVGCAVAMAWFWSQLAAALRLPTLVPAIGLGLILLNPFVLSAIGLEVLLIPTVLVGMLSTAVRRQPLAFGIVAGLAVLTRVDLIVFVVPLALASLGPRRELPRAVLTAILTCFPWFAWSWWSFGSAVPDTFVIKTLQRSFGSSTFANGWRLYYERDALATTVTFLTPLIGAIALLAWLAVQLVRRRAVQRELVPPLALGVAGAAYFVVYMLLGVPPYQWYYVPSYAALAISCTVLAGAALQGSKRTRELVAIPALTLLTAVVGASLVADVREEMPWTVPVVFGNWATPDDYARVGRELGERVGDATVIAPPEIGTLAYYCECSIVDAFSDRGRVAPLIEERRATASPTMRRFLDLNYRRLADELEPRPAQYQLIWEPGPATEPGQWQTWSPAAGVAHLTLVELPPP